MGVNRKVFIVKGFSNDEDELKSDKYHIEKYLEFFGKTAGGAYVDNELVYLEEPSSGALNSTLSQVELDYGILVYIGHGATQDDNQLFRLNKDEVIKAGQYEINSPKQVIIVESCRGQIEGVFTIDLEDKIPKFKDGGTVRIPLSKKIARDVYDAHIERCEKGSMVCLACSPGEEAYNYYFSRLILQNAINWYLEAHRHCAILPIDDLMGMTLHNTIDLAKSELDKDQKPQRIGIMNFPFAVSRY